MAKLTDNSISLVTEHTALNNKVDKIFGKTLTDVNFTTADKIKLDNLKTNIDISNLVPKTTTVNGHSLADNVVVTASDIGLANVNNTSDFDKPVSIIQNTINNTKVDKVAGKGLSTNDFTTVEKQKLQAITGINTGDQDLSGLVTKTTTINSKQLTDNIVLTKDDLGLSNVNNTSDLNKPVSFSTLEALSSKVDKVVGKELSSNDFTTSEKIKLLNLSGTNTGDQDLSGLVTKSTLVNGHSLSTDVTLNANDIGLGNVNNTSDLNKPVSTATQTALSTKADLVNGRVPAAQLPAYVDTIQEYVNLVSFPTTGEASVIYVDMAMNLIYRWSGTIYVKIPNEDLTNLVSKSTTVNGHSLASNVSLNATDIGLDNVNNTSDINKPISTATQTALDTKVDVVAGKALSTNDYTNADKLKVENISGINTGDQDLSVLVPISRTINNKPLNTDISINYIDVGLGNVNNTSDLDKPVSVKTQLALNDKVDKISGKGLSTNDFTTVEKQKLEAIVGINTGDQDLSGLVPTTRTVNNKQLTSNIVITALDIGLSNVNNTSDLNKPISTATAEALSLKVDKVAGKGLSTNDFTTSDKLKLENLSGVNTGDQDLSGLVPTSRTINGLPLTDDVVIDRTSIGLSNVDNTSDADKPVPSSVTIALFGKVDKIPGKGLTSNDFTDTYKQKLDTITGRNTGDQDLSQLVPIDRTINNKPLNNNIVITKEDLSLGNVDNTADVDKPISNVQATVNGKKADLVNGKVPSSQLPVITASAMSVMNMKLNTVVPLPISNIWYDLFTFTLTEGTWMIWIYGTHRRATNGTETITLRLFDGISSPGAARASHPNFNGFHTNVNLDFPITVSQDTVCKLQVMTDSGNANSMMLAAAIGTVSSDAPATQLTAMKIA